jgi:hypothetical protein
MSLIAELKRRNVFRVGAAYAIVAWLLIEVASVVLPALRLPEWTLTFLVFLLVIGFPIALIFAWAFELTPEGIKRETAVDSDESITHAAGRKLDFAIIGPPLGGSLLNNRIMGYRTLTKTQLQLPILRRFKVFLYGILPIKGQL